MTVSPPAVVFSTEHDRKVKWDNRAHIPETTSTRCPLRDPIHAPISSEDELDLSHFLGETESDATSMMTDDEDDQWSNLNILSLDGGGVRGYSSLLILHEIMRLVAEKEEPDAKSSIHSPLVGLVDEDSPNSTGRDALYSQFLPCHYFDYIAGTSTGSLIALMLGRLRFSTHEALEEYRYLYDRVLKKQASRLKRFSTKYSSEMRKEDLERRFDSLWPRQPSANEDYHQLKSDPARCKTIVCAIESNFSKSLQTPCLFRSYDTAKTPGKVDLPKSSKLSVRRSKDRAFTIGQAAIATSAAPSILSHTDLGDFRYYDAAILLNNPSWEVLNEVSVLNKKSHAHVDLLLSIGGGCAEGNYPEKRSRASSFYHTLANNSTVVDDQVRMASIKKEFSYYRLDVKKGLHDVKMNEWKPRKGGFETMQRIKRATEIYLRCEDVNREIHECAEHLVERRRRRSHTMLWERFAIGTRYRCPIEGCKTSRPPYQHRNALLDHLRTQHKTAPPDARHYIEIRDLLDAGRIKRGDT